ncbi:hypothetical protein N9L06_05800 [Mariniblastus sp.]|nr:hypothetical protein [Mariniblastus sp.]
MKSIVGTVFEKGRIDFSRDDNAWVFDMIDTSLKENQRDRIRFDPTQAPIQLKSAPINEGGEPEWMEGVERALKTADSVYLQFRNLTVFANSKNMITSLSRWERRKRSINIVLNTGTTCVTFTPFAATCSSLWSTR